MSKLQSDNPCDFRSGGSAPRRKRRSVWADCANRGYRLNSVTMELGYGRVERSILVEEMVGGPGSDWYQNQKGGIGAESEWGQGYESTASESSRRAMAARSYVSQLCVIDASGQVEWIMDTSGMGRRGVSSRGRESGHQSLRR